MSQFPCSIETTTTHSSVRAADILLSYGRRDDILVLANGEKVNPIPLEQHVQGDPRLKGVLLIGNGRIQSALIVEPRENLAEAERVQLLASLNARIEEANELTPSPGRVRRGMVICASPDKPFARTGKGTIVKKLTEDAYKNEIEHLYSSSSKEDRLVTVNLRSSTKAVYDSAAVISFLRQIIAVSFPQESTIGDDEDFVAHGLDSIQTLEITANLKRNLQGLTQASVSWITPRIIFRHSTLRGLAHILTGFLNDGVKPVEDSEASRSSAVEDMVARYVKDLPSKSPATTIDSAETSSLGMTVAVIGSTGYVGSQLVVNLLSNPVVSHIYCLDRSSDAAARLTASLKEIDVDINTSKLAFLKVEIGAPRLGLDQQQYEQIAKEVDVIVYNAWRLDFGLAIHSFEPFLHAARELVNLSVTGQRSPRIVFVSSLSSVEGLVTMGSTVPEAVVEDPLAAM